MSSKKSLEFPSQSQRNHLASPQNSARKNVGFSTLSKMINEKISEKISTKRFQTDSPFPEKKQLTFSSSFFSKNHLTIDTAKLKVSGSTVSIHSSASSLPIMASFNSGVSPQRKTLYTKTNMASLNETEPKTIGKMEPESPLQLSEERKHAIFNSKMLRTNSLFKKDQRKTNLENLFTSGFLLTQANGETIDQQSPSFLPPVKNKGKDFKIVTEKIIQNANFFEQYRLPPEKLQLLRKKEKSGFKMVSTKIPGVVKTEENEQNELRLSGYISQIDKNGLMPLPIPKILLNSCLIMVNTKLPRPEYGLAFGKFIKNNGEGLRHIYICRNFSSEKGLAALLETGFMGVHSVIENSDVVTFKYEDNQIGSSVSKVIMGLCEKMFFANIVDLSFSGCTFQNSGIQSTIFRSFRGVVKELRSINISNTCLSSSNLDDFLQLLDSSANHLEFLNLSSISITSHNLIKVLQFIEGKFKNLRQLILSKNSMAECADKCIESILDLLSVNQRMIHLDLSECGLGFSDCLKLFELLSVDLDQMTAGEPYSFLCSLHLTGNFITDEEIEETLGILNKKLANNRFQDFRHHLDEGELSNPELQLFSQEISSVYSDSMGKIQWPFFSHDLQEIVYPNMDVRVKLKQGQPTHEFVFKGKKQKKMEKIVFFRMLDLDLVTGASWFISSNCFICERWSKRTFKTNFKVESDPLFSPKSTFNDRRIGKKNIKHTVVVPKGISNSLESIETAESNLEGKKEMEKSEGMLSQNVFLSFEFLRDWPIWYQVNMNSGAHEFSFYFPPGRHKYFIGFGSLKKSQVSILYENEVSFGLSERNYEVNPNIGVFKRKKERVFSIEQSVFKNMIQETEHVNKQTMEFDTNNSKIHKFIPSATEREKLKESLEKYYRTIKGYYNYYAINSKYPCINMAGFDRFVQDAKLLDKKLTLTLVHQTFLTVTYEIEGNTESTESKLYRFEFTELLIRLASIKYLSTGKAKTHPEAFELMMEQDVLPNVINHSASVNDFREKHMYNLEVNDMLERNIEGLTKIFRKYRNLDGLVPFEDIRGLLINVLNLKMSEREILRFFAACKQVIMDEVTQFKSYTGFTFVEFLEWVCRISEQFVLEIKGGEQLPISEKIGRTIDALFVPLKMKRAGLEKKRTSVLNAK